MTATDSRLEVLLDPLRAWLAARIDGATDVRLGEFVEPVQGFSNQTILFRMSWTEHGEPRERDLVARIRRPGNPPLIEDVMKQWRIMEVLNRHADVPVPPLAFAESDSSVLGEPFFLMDRVDGRVPPDSPSYHVAGWVADLSVEQRNRLWWNGIEAMARLHDVDWREFSFLYHRSDATPGMAHHVETFLGGFYDWSREGRPYPVVEAGLRHLLDHAPEVTRAGLVWNDARLGNTMFKDLDVAALIDFEASEVGPAEIDLGWWLYAEDLFASGGERLEGIPQRDDAIAGFERIYGRSMGDFRYWEAVAAMKLAVISIRSWHNAAHKNSEFSKSRRSAPFDHAIEWLGEYLGMPVQSTLDAGTR